MQKQEKNQPFYRFFVGKSIGKQIGSKNKFTG